jgi:hypothetical protein
MMTGEENQILHKDIALVRSDDRPNRMFVIVQLREGMLGEVKLKAVYANPGSKNAELALQSGAAATTFPKY